MAILRYFLEIGALIASICFCSAWNVPKADISEELKAPGYTIEEWEAMKEEPETIAETEAPTQAATEPASATVRAFSEDDKYLLIRVAWLEAGNQGWQGMAAVMNVLINRAELYNASIRAIVYSPGQFDGVTAMIDTCTPTPEAETALFAVMQGWDISQGALYFCSPAHNGWHSSHLTYLFTFGGHEFYR